MWLSRMHAGILLSVQQICRAKIKLEETSTTDERPKRDSPRRSEEESFRLNRRGNAIRGREKEGQESVVDGEPRTCSPSGKSGTLGFHYHLGRPVLSAKSDSREIERMRRGRWR